ncbi:MAG: 2-amino-4-hydroxy-6-hydroxymethyldihydropteridine diphosphokinase [Bacteroidales bacterium]|nr:2-amino-4-hydroxy-6-hydroxymethyldihydropteridine diphosphokinase [Bacteroidales bacterium]
MTDQTLHKAWIGLGSNLGDRRDNMVSVCRMMKDLGIKIIRESGIYKSAAWGYRSEHLFYNQCLLVETVMEPLELLRHFQSMEKEAGRIKNYERYTDRNIDIDILFYDDLVIDSEYLSIPHPELTKRMFVLKPLNEIDPEKKHPLLGKPVKVLLEECTDRSEVHLVRS